MVKLVNRLLSEFSAQTHTAPDGAKFQATFSAGVAMLEAGDPVASVESWKQRADDALYRAKAEGRNRVRGWMGTSN